MSHFIEALRFRHKPVIQESANLVPAFLLTKDALSEVTNRVNSAKFKIDAQSHNLSVRENSDGVIYLQKESDKIEMMILLTGELDPRLGEPAIYIVGHSDVYPNGNGLRCKIIPIPGLTQNIFNQEVYGFLTSNINFTIIISDDSRPELYSKARAFLTNPTNIG